MRPRYFRIVLLPLSLVLGASLKTLSSLTLIAKVEQSSRANLVFYLNDEFYLLVEGSFRVCDGESVIFSSDEYVESNFNISLLDKLRQFLVNKKIDRVSICENTGELVITFYDDTTLEIIYDTDTSSLWQLFDGRDILYSSEGGSIVQYIS